MMPDSKNFFDDLPDEKEEKPKTEAEKEAEAAKLENLSKAEKEADKTLAELKQKRDEALKEKRKKIKEMKAEIKAVSEKEPENKQDEKDDKSEDEPPKEDITKTVKETVADTFRKERETKYDSLVVAELKKAGVSRQAAEEAYEEYLKLPKSLGSGMDEGVSAKLDAEFALNRIKKIREAKRGFMSPRMEGGAFEGSGGETTEDGLSERQRTTLQDAGFPMDKLKDFRRSDGSYGSQITKYFNRKFY